MGEGIKGYAHERNCCCCPLTVGLKVYFVLLCLNFVTCLFDIKLFYVNLIFLVPKIGTLMSVLFIWKESISARKCNFITFLVCTIFQPQAIILASIVGYTYILDTCYEYITDLGDDAYTCDIGTRTKTLFVFVIAFIVVITFIFDVWITLLMKAFWEEV